MVHSSFPKVLPVRPPEDKLDCNEGLHPHLPHAPCVVCIYGSYRSGKSNLIMQFLANPDFMRSRMDKVVLISPTALNDDTFRHVVDDDDVEIISEYSDDWLNAFLQFQMETPREERSSVMMIADDALQYIKPRGRGSALTNLCTKFRHYLGGKDRGGYLMYVSQHFKGLPPVIRCNTGYMIIMKIPNIQVLKDMAFELDGFLNGNFITLYSYCIYDEPYSFLSIDMRENPPICYLRFEKPIFQGRFLIPEPPKADINTIMQPKDELKSNLNTENVDLEKKS